MSRPRSSPAVSIAASAAGLVALALGAAPWFAGTVTVVEPGVARRLLVAAAVGGILAIGAAALARRAHPAVRGAVLALGLLAVGSSPAFMGLLARQSPAEPRTVGAAGPAAASDRLRVLQWNAWHGYPSDDGAPHLPAAQAARQAVAADQPERTNRPERTDRLVRADRLAAAIARLQPDVVVLQEAWCTVTEGCLADRLAADLAWHAVYARANGSLRWLGFEEGAAILSRFPISAPEAWPLLPDRGRFERRIALAARVDHPALSFEVVGVHAANDDAELAAAQTRHLLDRLLDRSERPAVIAGDFNLPGDHAVFSRFAEAGYRGVLAGGIDHVLVDAEASGWWPLWSEWTPPSTVTGRGLATAGNGNDLATARSGRGLVTARNGGPAMATSGHGPATAASRRGPAAAPSGRGLDAGDPGRQLPVSDHPGILVEFQLPTPPPDDAWAGDRAGDWELLPADRVGLDAARLEQAVDDIGALDGVQGVLVSRRGRLVAEQYYRGADGRRPHNMKSASKSVLSALAGLAVAEGVLDLDQPIAELLPEAAELDDPGKRAITVRHLLTMTSGLESTSFGNYGSWVASRNWVRAALERPLQAEPGTRFSYSTGSTHLLSATLARAAGQSTHDFARERLFAPLGFRRSAWARDRQGVHVGGNNLSLLPRDMLKFGQLYLNRGRWAGEQLLPWQWVDESTRPGLAGPRGRGRIYGGYGYLWWLRGPRERGAYIASGYGGQYIYVAPAEDLVVVIISTEVSKGRDWRRALFSIVRTGIAGSVIDPYARQG